MKKIGPRVGEHSSKLLLCRSATGTDRGITSAMWVPETYVLKPSRRPCVLPFKGCTVVWAQCKGQPKHSRYIQYNTSREHEETGLQHTRINTQNTGIIPAGRRPCCCRRIEGGDWPATEGGTWELEPGGSGAWAAGRSAPSLRLWSSTYSSLWVELLSYVRQAGSVSKRLRKNFPLHKPLHFVTHLSWHFLAYSLIIV